MHITILGSGIMGSQLAALMSLLDFDVTIRSRNNNLNVVEKNKKLLSKIIKLDFKSNIINYKNINESFDGQSLVIECLKENLQIKKEYFIKYKSTKYGYFSNSSSFANSDVNNEIDVLHFFNPVSIKILEVCISNKDKYDNSILNNLIEKLKNIDFKFFYVHQNRGFLGNTIIFYHISNYFYLHEKLNYNVQDISKMQKEFGINFNPLNIIDIVGVDVCFEILKNLKEKNNNLYIPEIFNNALKKNILGKKNKTSISSILS